MCHFLDLDSHSGLDLIGDLGTGKKLRGQVLLTLLDRKLKVLF